mgnify:FL=1
MRGLVAILTGCQDGQWISVYSNAPILSVDALVLNESTLLEHQLLSLLHLPPQDGGEKASVWNSPVLVGRLGANPPPAVL